MSSKGIAAIREQPDSASALRRVLCATTCLRVLGDMLPAADRLRLRLATLPLGSSVTRAMSDPICKYLWSVNAAETASQATVTAPHKRLALLETRARLRDSVMAMAKADAAASTDTQPFDMTKAPFEDPCILNWSCDAVSAIWAVQAATRADWCPFPGPMRLATAANMILGAATQGRLAVVQELWRRYAAQVGEWMSSVAMAAAAFGGRLEVMTWLVANAPPVADPSPLLPMAALGGHLELVRIMSERGWGAWGAVPAPYWTSVLSAAAYSGNMALMEWLLQRGESPAQLPIDVARGAAAGGSIEMLDSVRQRCASSILQDAKVWEAAASHGHVAVLEWGAHSPVLRAGAAGRAQPTWGDSVLAAAEAGQAQVLEWLESNAVLDPAHVTCRTITGAINSGDPHTVAILWRCYQAQHPAPRNLFDSTSDSESYRIVASRAAGISGRVELVELVKDMLGEDWPKCTQHVANGASLHGKLHVLDYLERDENWSWTDELALTARLFNQLNVRDWAESRNLPMKEDIC